MINLLDSLTNQDGVLQNNNFRQTVFSDTKKTENMHCKGNIVNEDHFKRIYIDDINKSLFEFSKEFESNNKSEIVSENSAIDSENDRYNIGFADGQSQGVKIEKEKIFSKLNLINQTIDELKKYKKTIYKNAEKSVLDLALTISKKIVYNEVLINKNIVLSVISESLKKVMDQEKIIVKVNSEDLLFIKENKKLLNEMSLKNNTVKFVEDCEVQCGGCIIETDSGVIDARTESQFNAIEEAIKESLKG